MSEITAPSSTTRDDRNQKTQGNTKRKGWRNLYSEMKKAYNNISVKYRNAMKKQQSLINDNRIMSAQYRKILTQHCLARKEIDHLRRCNATLEQQKNKFQADLERLTRNQQSLQQQLNLTEYQHSVLERYTVNLAQNKELMKHEFTDLRRRYDTLYQLFNHLEEDYRHVLELLGNVN